MTQMCSIEDGNLVNIVLLLHKTTPMLLDAYLLERLYMTQSLLARYEPKSQLFAYRVHGFTSLPHGFFTNEGGVSEGGFASLNCALSKSDAPENILENRGRVSTFLSVIPSHLLTAKQPHGAEVVLVDEAWSIEERPNVDAIVTRQCGIAVGVVAADCLQILFADLENGVIAAAHAGHKGLLNGIIKNTVSTMLAAGAKESRIHAAIGPCIAYDSYEVGDDLYTRFTANDPMSAECFKPSRISNNKLFDLAGYGQKLLFQAGVQSVCTVPVDTYSDRRFFSHRRKTHSSDPSAQIGNHIAAIALSP